MIEKVSWGAWPGRLCEREWRLRLSVIVRVGWGTWPIGLRVRGRVGLRAPRELSDRESRLGRLARGTQCERESRLRRRYFLLRPETPLERPGAQRAKRARR